MNELREILKALYVKGCLDSLNRDNTGKGKKMCEKSVDKTERQIRDWAKGKVPEEKDLVGMCRIFGAGSSDHNIGIGHNYCRDEMIENLEEE